MTVNAAEDIWAEDIYKKIKCMEKCQKSGIWNYCFDFIKYYNNIKLNCCFKNMIAIFIFLY